MVTVSDTSRPDVCKDQGCKNPTCAAERCPAYLGRLRWVGDKPFCVLVSELNQDLNKDKLTEEELKTLSKAFKMNNNA